MFCKNCGAEITDNAKFCPKCGNLKTNLSPQGYAIKNRSKHFLLIIIVILIITLIIIFNISKNGRKSANDAAGTYLVACYEQDADTIISLVPDEILKGIMKEYGCSKKQLKQAVEDELPNEAKNYHDCGSVKGYEKSKNVDKYNYSRYIDWRVEDCADLDKISNMKVCWVNVEDDYYYKNISVYQYGKNKKAWYSMGATNFVAYAVWEKY